MEPIDPKYDALLAKLKTVHPVLENKQALTDDIMQNIHKKNKTIRGPILLSARPILSVAAAFLIGLLVYETYFLPINSMKGKPIEYKHQNIINSEYSEMKPQNKLQTLSIWKAIQQLQKPKTLADRFKEQYQSQTRQKEL